MQYKHLTIEEREYIQRSLWEKKSGRSIANDLGRSPASICREIKRNLPLERFLYTPRLAQERALKKRKNRGRQDRLKNQTIRDYVISHLRLRWSPEQIAGRIQIDIGKSISHEAIYQYIYHQFHREGHGYLKTGCQDLRTYLRRRKKRRTPKGLRRCQRIFKPRGSSIEARPTVVAKRSRIGDWEGDTVESINHKPGINTLVERKTGLVFITKLKDRTSQATTLAVIERTNWLPRILKQTLTIDNGPENQAWQKIESRTGLRCFYAHPYCSGERGTNENTNGLIRDYLPKKTDFTEISQEELSRVEYMLNARPRKRLDWRTPLEIFTKELNKFKINISIPSVALVG
ncbi:IS30 family transposase [Patescibacteria group bacterium]|nr:IS30 family transposase [Patescibacteria group bacterium]